MIKSALQSSLTNDVKYRSMSAGNLPSSEYLIETAIVGATPVASVVFNDLAQYAGVYRHLQIVAVARTDRAAAGDDLSIQLNGDTGSNYTWRNLKGNGSSVTNEVVAINNTWMGNYALAGGTTTSNVFSAQVTDILDPFNSNKNTTIRSLSGMASNNNSIDLTSGFWNNPASLTSIRIFLRLGTNYVQYSRFSLYGVV